MFAVCALLCFVVVGLKQFTHMLQDYFIKLTPVPMEQLLGYLPEWLHQVNLILLSLNQVFGGHADDNVHTE